MTSKKPLRIENLKVPKVDIDTDGLTDNNYNSMYYYPNKLFSYDPKKYWYYICIGSRGKGKTVSGWRWVLKRFLKHDEMFIWLRLTEAPIKKAARNQGTTLAPQFLLKQLGILSLTMRGNVIYLQIEEDDKIVTKMCGVMDAISTFYTSKGQDMSSYTNVVFDEINRESGERTTFDITRAFINQIETIARFRTIRVLMLGNTILDTSEILSLFNFQPKEFGIYKLTRKHAIIEYLDDSEEFKAARKKSMAGVLLGDNEDISTSFTNKSKTFRDNVEPHDTKNKQLFRFYIGEFKVYGVYDRKEGLYIGEVRNIDTPAYKISPFMNCEGIYDREVEDTFLTLISQNLIFYETLNIRTRFVKALKSSRSAIY